jgi:hypothetical protein
MHTLTVYTKLLTPPLRQIFSTLPLPKYRGGVLLRAAASRANGPHSAQISRNPALTGGQLSVSRGGSFSPERRRSGFTLRHKVIVFVMAGLSGESIFSHSRRTRLLRSISQPRSSLRSDPSPLPPCKPGIAIHRTSKYFPPITTRLPRYRCPDFPHPPATLKVSRRTFPYARSTAQSQGPSHSASDADSSGQASRTGSYIYNARARHARRRKQEPRKVFKNNNFRVRFFQIPYPNEPS